MNVTRIKHIPDLIVVEPRVFKDPRGYFVETYQAERYAEHGICATFIQDNMSRSTGKVVRGLHYQIGRPQTKLVSVAYGEVFDVAVDVRLGSPTFGQWAGVTLSDQNCRQFLIPEGFAHGFAALADKVVFTYKCTDFYCPEGERGIRWDCPTIGIDWPTEDPVLSEKDAKYVTLEEMAEEDLPVWDG